MCAPRSPRPHESCEKMGMFHDSRPDNQAHTKLHKRSHRLFLNVPTMIADTLWHRSRGGGDDWHVVNVFPDAFGVG